MRLKKFGLDKIPENTLALKSLKQIDGYPVFFGYIHKVRKIFRKEVLYVNALIKMAEIFKKPLDNI